LPILARIVKLVAPCAAVLLVSTLAPAGEFELGTSMGYGGGARDPAFVEGNGRFLGTSAAVTFFQRVPMAAGLGATFDGGPVARLFGGYRFLEGLVSIGVSGRARVTTAEHVRGVDYDPRVGLALGPYLRVYPLRTRTFEAWASIGLEYAVERLTYRRPQDDEIHLTHHGLGIPLSIGIDYRASPAVAIGPTFQLTHVHPLSACYDGPPLTNLDPNLGTSLDEGCTKGWSIEAQPYTTWSVSLGARFTL